MKKQQLEDYEEATRYYERVINYGRVGTTIQILIRGLGNIRGLDNTKSESFKVMADILKDDKTHEVQQILESSYSYYGFKNTIFSTDIVAAAYNGITNIKAIHKEHEEAINNYNKAIKRDSGSVIFYRNRGISKGRSGDYKGAILDFNEAIELDPTNTAVYKNRGNAKFGLGERRSDFGL